MLSNVHIELEIVLHDGAAIMEHSAPHSEEAYASVLKNLPTACSLSSGLPALADAAVALRCASYQTNVKLASSESETWQQVIDPSHCSATFFRTNPSDDVTKKAMRDSTRTPFAAVHCKTYMLVSSGNLTRKSKQMMFPGIVPHDGTFVPRNVPDSPCTVSDLVT
jgi:hypothetical protein